MMFHISLTRLSRPLRCVHPLRAPARLLPIADKHSLSHWVISRPYTSGQNTPSPLLTSALDQKQGTSHSSREDSVGPFQLGIPQAVPRRGEKTKKWSELSVGGKVIRTTQRTTNLTVILLGAGLSAVLIYALTSELFSKNSPTVLYNDACERIKASPRVAKYLHAPLTFHNNPPSSVRPRHRHRHVASQIALDSSGREHMLLNFYIHGSSLASYQTEDGEDSHWTGCVDSLASLTFEDVNERLFRLIHLAKGAFKYLRGDSVTPVTSPVTTDKEGTKSQEGTKGQEGAEEQSWWGLTGLFSGLRGRRSHDVGGHGAGTTWTEGEVHADLVRNDEGYFVFKYLLIDIPNSESRNPIRVFVERAPGVRENEPIMRFHPY